MANDDKNIMCPMADIKKKNPSPMAFCHFKICLFRTLWDNEKFSDWNKLYYFPR